MSKKPFQVGDRVVAYAGKRKVGIITTTDAGHHYYGPIGIECLGENGKYTEFVHPKQCRRLVKKPRRRIWVSEYNTKRVSSPSAVIVANIASKQYEETDVCFVEVKRK